MQVRVTSLSLIFGNVFIRRIYKSPKKFLIENVQSFDDLRPYFHELQMNKNLNQSKIAKLSSFYKNLNLSEFRKEDPLNGALYFHSIFSKTIPDELLSAAFENVSLIRENVLKVTAQKLLCSNQWPIAVKLVDLKYKCAIQQNNVLQAEIIKLEVLAANGNLQMILELRPHLAKLDIPTDIQLKLFCLLNSEDGKDFAKLIKECSTNVTESDRSHSKNNETNNRWSHLLQYALRCRLLSVKPPTFDVFLLQAAAISSKFQALDPKLILIAAAKCQGISSMSILDSESLERLKLLYAHMSKESLLFLATKFQGVNKAFPEKVVSLLLENLSGHSVGVDGNILSSLICWIIRFCPESFSFKVLMTDYSKVLDENVAKMALKSIGLFDCSTMQFIEFCMINKDIAIDPKIFLEAMDIACEQFGFEPTELFLKHSHQKGYKLSSKFYLNYLKRKLLTRSIGLIRAYECFKRISSQILYGDLLQNYLKVGQDLLEMSLEESNLDLCLKIYQSTSKFQLLQTLLRPKSFKHFIFESCATGKITKPFKCTINMECIDTALECVQNSLIKQLKLEEKFCSTALQSALINVDFITAQRLHIYMNNQGYCDAGLAFGRNVLRQWANKIHK